ncbi:MAG TPA: RNA polymerase subunit sigma-24 [Chloroflexi bacterium]|nr:RNA polymerase subunit sigma-24 [Chloroflexota bacterium]HBY09013.1 RNA polymerase subunit sigma-24 [Chloroflexota bacterium]
MDEISLIRDAQQGDLEAFNRLILAYQEMVYNQAYRVIGETDAAEDATQEAFISAYRKLDSYRGGSFKAWLLRIVTNACYDELRRRKRRPVTPLEPTDDYDEEIESPHWIADPGESPEEFALRTELSEAIQRCLDTLSDDFRTVVILVDIQGMDYTEASEVMGTPLGTIKSRLARARRGLRHCLRDVWELLPTAFRLENEAQDE